MGQRFGAQGNGERLVATAGSADSCVLTDHGLVGRQGEVEWPFEDLLGASHVAGSLEVTVHRCARVGPEPKPDSRTTAKFKSADLRKRRLTRHKFSFPDAGTAASWAQGVNTAVRPGDEGRGRRFLCIINPASGAGHAQNIFVRDALPVLEAAGSTLEVCVTKAAGEAIGIVKEMKLDSFDGILVAGGDGSLHEVLEGLCSRTDASVACKSLAISHIPGGSGNAVAFNVACENNESGDAVAAAYIAVKGHATAVDAGIAWDSQGKPWPLLLSAEFALISDIDFESEPLRCCGSLRFTIMALQRILCLRRYPACIHYLPAEADDAGSGAPTAEEFYRLCAGGVAAGRSPILGPEPGAQNNGSAGAWLRHEGNFNVCIACNASWIDTSTPIAPDSRLTDGVLTLVTSRNLSRCTLLREFLKIEDGRHLENDHVQALRVRAFRLVPEADAPSAIGVDGEMVSPMGEVGRFLEVVCYPAVLRLFMLPKKSGRPVEPCSSRERLPNAV
eukprot:TRINITY_DN25098_c0_g1_i1.p1 TRINITY_DN25098_c0_g1~~TRINITY_DN25098_c0_g1_i1.p1  ORF type:complete len:503 (-),score=74.48 TRINITY_DN25098_c0_g1_i1:57-1565(-)